MEIRSNVFRHWIGLMADDRKVEAKRVYLEKGLTQGEIADRLDVSRRTIERWASEDGWNGQKKAQKVVPISEAKTQNSLPHHPLPVLTPVQIRLLESHHI